MAPANLLIASLNFTRTDSFSSGLYRFAADRSLVLSGAEAGLAHIPESVSSWWHEWSSKISELLSRPGKP